MPFVNCPACDAESIAPRQLIGLLWDCPKCGEPMRVTEDGAEPAGARKARRRPDPPDDDPDVEDLDRPVRRRRRRVPRELASGIYAGTVCAVVGLFVPCVWLAVVPLSAGGALVVARTLRRYGWRDNPGVAACFAVLCLTALAGAALLAYVQFLLVTFPRS